MKDGLWGSFTYTYLILMGEFSDTDPYDYITWIVFVFVTVLQLIIMLNLLVAIISATFDRVCTD